MAQLFVRDGMILEATDVGQPYRLLGCSLSYLRCSTAISDLLAGPPLT